MTINSDGYLSNGKAWKKETSAQVRGVSKKKKRKSPHSEIQVINVLTWKNGPYLIVQNGFPCSGCDDHFKNKSKQSKKNKKPSFVVFKITANNGSYSADHDFDINYNHFPTYIYYQNGNKVIRDNSNVPKGFPVCPSFNGLDI